MEKIVRVEFNCGHKEYQIHREDETSYRCGYCAAKREQKKADAKKIMDYAKAYCETENTVTYHVCSAMADLIKKAPLEVIE